MRTSQTSRVDERSSVVGPTRDPVGPVDRGDLVVEVMRLRRGLRRILAVCASVEGTAGKPPLGMATVAALAAELLNPTTRRPT